MRNLFQFLYRIRIFVLFILLEAVAFIWIHNSRSYQRSVFHNSANQLTGGMLEQVNRMDELFSLYDQNEKLAAENARLKSQLESSKLTIAPLDSQYREVQQYSYISGEAVHLSFRKAQNYLMINRGSEHGVESGMGVSGPEGVVGITNDVSKHFSTVIPIIHPGFSVSGKIRDRGFFGPVRWNTSDYRYASLTDIPRYAEFSAGDTVVTDAKSRIFPEGIVIGFIENAEMQDDQNFYEIRLRLATDFASLNQVYIIENKLRKEAENLLSPPQD